jgi:hypothetical protein
VEIENRRKAPQKRLIRRRRGRKSRVTSPFSLEGRHTSGESRMTGTIVAITRIRMLTTRNGRRQAALRPNPSVRRDEQKPRCNSLQSMACTRLMGDGRRCAPATDYHEGAHASQRMTDATNACDCHNGSQIGIEGKENAGKEDGAMVAASRRAGNFFSRIFLSLFALGLGVAMATTIGPKDLILSHSCPRPESSFPRPVCLLIGG